MVSSAAELTDFFERQRLGSPDRAVGFVLWRVMHRYQRNVERALAPLGLTHLQFTTLAMAGWLCRAEGRTTQVALAQAADIHPMQVSLMLKALEAKGMVARVRAPADTRTKLVAVTGPGLEALAAAMPVVIAIQERLFGAPGAPGGAPGAALLAALRRVEDAAGG